MEYGFHMWDDVNATHNYLKPHPKVSHLIGLNWHRHSNLWPTDMLFPHSTFPIITKTIMTFAPHNWLVMGYLLLGILNSFKLLQITYNVSNGQGTTLIMTFSPFFWLSPPEILYLCLQPLTNYLHKSYSKHINLQILR